MRFVMIATMLAASTGAAHAQESGDASRGRALAEKVCAECHAVAPGRAVSPKPEVAAFEVIANTPGMTALALNVWLTTPHRDMPHLLLDAGARDDVIAYVVSLKR